jgi:hypothetical protein
MTNKPIPVSTANDMITGYISFMTGLKVDMSKQTQSVSFTSSALMDWLSGTMPYADELRVCMGMYPPGHEQAGRTTVILWPYKNGNQATKPITAGKDGGGDDEKIPPYNEGGGLP